jgi:diaminopropionate ammonia-lyase
VPGLLDYFANPARDPIWEPEPGLEAEARRLHRTTPGYAPTPLLEARTLAGELGLRSVLLKDECERFGLPAFKALGAFWACAWAVAQRLRTPALATDPQALKERAKGSRLELACATEGNHGRAVARAAARLGLEAHVVVPGRTAEARVRAIEAEGAEVERVDGDYDAAIEHAASLATDRRLVIADTSWPGYVDIPRRVVEGYSTIFAELDGADPDVVLVPIGVGSLAAAAARHFRPGRARLVGVEPAAAACALASARAGEPVTVPGPHDSLMAGLNCATPSPDAWPALSAAFDGFAAVDDDVVRAGMRRLAEGGLDRGACAGGVVGALAGLRDELPAGGTALLLLTEGVTDRAGFEAAVGRPPA